jgi:hypothetical protein
VPYSGVRAVLLQVSAASVGRTPEAGVTFWPAGQARPVTRDLTVGRGFPDAELVVVRPGAGGRIRLATTAGTTQIYAQIVGYYR